MTVITAGITCSRRYNRGTQLGVRPQFHAIVLKKFQWGYAARNFRSLRRCHSWGRERGICISPTKCGAGDKIEIVTAPQPFLGHLQRFEFALNSLEDYPITAATFAPKRSSRSAYT